MDEAQSLTMMDGHHVLSLKDLRLCLGALADPQAQDARPVAQRALWQDPVLARETSPKFFLTSCLNEALAGIAGDGENRGMLPRERHDRQID